jgi:hypothetical protein
MDVICTYLERLADVIDYVCDRLERRVVAVEETLETEHGIVSALGRVEQIRRWVPRVVVRLVEVEGLEDRNLWTGTLHAPQDQGR